MLREQRSPPAHSYSHKKRQIRGNAREAPSALNQPTNQPRPLSAIPLQTTPIAPLRASSRQIGPTTRQKLWIDQLARKRRLGRDLKRGSRKIEKAPPGGLGPPGRPPGQGAGQARPIQTGTKPLPNRQQTKGHELILEGHFGGRVCAERTRLVCKGLTFSRGKLVVQLRTLETVRKPPENPRKTGLKSATWTLGQCESDILSIAKARDFGVKQPVSPCLYCSFYLCGVCSRAVLRYSVL